MSAIFGLENVGSTAHFIWMRTSPVGGCWDSYQRYIVGTPLTLSPNSVFTGWWKDRHLKHAPCSAFGF